MLSTSGILYIALYLALTWVYGKIRWSEGVRSGLTMGVVTGSTSMFAVFQQKHVVSQDRSGNVYRINDIGERGETIISATDAPNLSMVLSGSRNLSVDKESKSE